MDANEMRAISQLVADLNAEIHNEVRMLHDRVSVLEGQVAAWEQWGAQVNDSIVEIATRIAAVQQHVVENVTTGVYASEVTEHYRRFVTAEAARAGVELRDLQAEIKRRQQNDVSATMDPLIDVEG
jgi:hypothetical protein